MHAARGLAGGNAANLKHAGTRGTYSCVDVKVPRNETKKATEMSHQSNFLSSCRNPSESSILAHGQP